MISIQQRVIDLNRSGVALMEIVSRPDLRSAEQAGAYIKIAFNSALFGYL